jgi:hypothetical protein
MGRSTMDHGAPRLQCAIFVRHTCAIYGRRQHGFMEADLVAHCGEGIKAWQSCLRLGLIGGNHLASRDLSLPSGEVESDVRRTESPAFVLEPLLEILVLEVPRSLPSRHPDGRGRRGQSLGTS